MSELRPNKGFHPILEEDHSYIFIDSCMQIWPDAEYDKFHLHGFTAVAVTSMRPHTNVEDGIEDLMFWHLIARKHPEIIVANSADDIRRAKGERKAVLVLAAQGGDFIENKLHRIEALYRLGLRMLIPAYNTSNMICDGCLDRTNSGLTRFGELVVKECNRVGMLLDCTHIGHRASLEVIERSELPVVFSHSNPRAVVDNPRNIHDDQIKACADKGGVIGLAPWGPLVMKQSTSHWPTVNDFIDLIDYVSDITGSTEHIGIGTDMSLGSYPDHKHDPWGEPVYPDVSTTYGRLVTSRLLSPKRNLDGFNSYPDVLNLIEQLLKRRYSQDDVARMLGENYLRVFGQVWC